MNANQLEEFLQEVTYYDDKEGALLATKVVTLQFHVDQKIYVFALRGNTTWRFIKNQILISAKGQKLRKYVTFHLTP